MTNYNFEKVFFVFNKNYQPIPLEVFGKDPYKTLISTLLSSRTKDEVTLEASNRLFNIAKNIKLLRNLDIILIEELIYPVGFYKTKSKHLHNLAEIIEDKYEGIIPKTQAQLIELPGVGIKTANLVLNRAYKIPAIAVDTHVHKISNLLGWVKTKSPEATEKELTEILPKKYWSETNRLFVSIGRRFNSSKKLVDFLRKEKLI